jgi:hypothetical protein
MTQLVQQLIIHGVTHDGQRFRPSDWAERLAGVMSQFRPAGSVGGPLTYSPYVVPVILDGVRCVVVDKRLRELEPLAFKFVCSFAEDNNLKLSEHEATIPTSRP